MNHSKISIIIPVYNSETYIHKCIDSVLAQSYKNIEVICINDGSTDNSLGVLRKYEEADNRLIVIDKENEGVSAARNAGLKASGGDYIMFVDSDDWIDDCMCEAMLKCLQENSADACMCCYVKEFDGHSAVESIFGRDVTFEEDEFKEKFYRRLFGLYKEELKHPEKCDSIVSVWMQLFKRELVENVEFIDLKLIGTAEDLMFQIMAYRNCSKLVYIDKPWYHYIKSNASSITSTYKPKLYEQREYMFSLMDEIIKEYKLPKEYSAALKNRIAFNMIGLGLNENYSGKSIFKQAKSLKKVLSQPRYKDAFVNLEYKYLPLHWWLFFKLCKMRFALPLAIMIKIINYLRKQ